MLTQILLDFWWVWGRFFDNFASKLEGRGTKKPWKTLGFLAFLLFPPTCQQEATWSIFWLTWPPTGGPKPCKNVHKRLPKSIKKCIQSIMQVGLDFGALLGRFWVDLVPKLGGKLDPSWYQNLKNWGPKTMSKKSSKKGGARWSGKIKKFGLAAPKNPSGISKTTIPGSQEPIQALLHSTIVPRGTVADNATRS